MFTLKLFRRKGPDTLQKMHKVAAAHRVVVMDIGEKGTALELQVFPNAHNNDYETYYIGEPSPGMDAHGRDDLHLGTEPGSWWGWGLLENWEGNTSEHYRPASYG
jgi:hypothetical protein